MSTSANKILPESADNISVYPYKNDGRRYLNLRDFVLNCAKDKYTVCNVYICDISELEVIVKEVTGKNLAKWRDTAIIVEDGKSNLSDKINEIAKTNSYVSSNLEFFATTSER